MIKNMYEKTSAKTENNKKTSKKDNATNKHSLDKSKNSSSCGSCGACRSLSSPRLSSENASSVLSHAKAMGKESCAVSFMQRNYGNRFTASVLSPTIQKKCSCGGSCSKCKGEEDAEKVAMSIMKMESPAISHQPSAIRYKPSAISQPDEQTHISEIMSSKGSGHSLDDNARSFMEPRFGYDFGNVRIHTDGYAARKSNDLNAEAFTIGRDIFFNAGRYNPSATEGKQLLAHELTHVVQQEDNVVAQAALTLKIVSCKEKNASEFAIIEESDDNVYTVSDKKAIKCTQPPILKSTGRIIPWDSQIKIEKRYEKDGKRYVFVAKAYGDKSDLGWTLESNLKKSDVPSEKRYGCKETSAYFIKDGKYLQQETINALGNINNPIEIKNNKGEVTDSYYLRLTECMYPGTFDHKSKGHYSGHCVDIGLADKTGHKKAYNGKGKITIEEQGAKAFESIYKHNNHLHGCVSYQPWVKTRNTEQLKDLLKERKDEFGSVVIRTTAPPTPPSPAPCALPVPIGTGRTGCGLKTDDDFKHFDKPRSISRASTAKLAVWAATRPLSRGPFRSLVTDMECEIEMDAVLTILSGGAGHDAFIRFATGTGGTKTHNKYSMLGALALGSPEIKSTVASVKSIIESQLVAQAASGTLNPCVLLVKPPATHFASKKFYYPGALKSIVGGTHGEKLFATGFTGDIPSRSYTIDLRFLICDNFGVDESDLYAPGLFAFWVLQHERSASRYAPFINQLDLPVTVSGTF